MTTSNRAFVFAFALASAGSVTQACAHPTIVTVDFGGAGTAAGQGTQMIAINGKGDAAGRYIDQNDVSRGFVLRADGSTVFIDVNDLMPAAFSGRGVMAGSDSDFLATHGFIYVVADDDYIPVDGPDNRDNVLVEDIDGAGEAVGYFTDLDRATHGFLRTRRGKFKAFDAPGAEPQTFARAVNGGGVICGNVVDGLTDQGFVRDPAGAFTTFAPPNSIDALPVAINAGGTVGGRYDDASQVMHGFLRGADGTITAVDAPMAGTGSLQGTAIASLNNHDVAAGTFIDSAGVGHGFVRSAAGHITAFDAPGAGTAAGQGTFAGSISNRNQIAGYVIDATGVFHGFVRTP